MVSITCCCSSPDCMVNGCAIYRQQQQAYRDYSASGGVGWTCPNCNAGVAPHLDSCPVCNPQATYTRIVIQTPNFENPEGDNHERPKDCKIVQDPTEEDQG